MSAGRICVREVDFAEVTESVQAAAQRMHARNVGTLVVLDKEKQPVGILSLDDILDLLIGEFRDIGVLLNEESPRSLAKG